MDFLKEENVLNSICKTLSAKSELISKDNLLEYISSNLPVEVKPGNIDFEVSRNKILLSLKIERENNITETITWSLNKAKK